MRQHLLKIIGLLIISINSLAANSGEFAPDCISVSFTNDLIFQNTCNYSVFVVWCDTNNCAEGANDTFYTNSQDLQANASYTTSVLGDRISWGACEGSVGVESESIIHHNYDDGSYSCLPTKDITPTGTKATQENVTKLYVATFNRAPDAAGLNYWVNTSGLGLENIAQSFFDQPETQTLYPSSSTNTTFIHAIYNNLFNRSPDQAGFDYWKAEIDSGRIAKSVFILAVVNGALGTDADILTNKTDVGLAFAEAGMNDADDAKDILSGVTDNPSTVEIAFSSFNLDFHNFIYLDYPERAIEALAFVWSKVSSYSGETKYYGHGPIQKLSVSWDTPERVLELIGCEKAHTAHAFTSGDKVGHIVHCDVPLYSYSEDITTIYTGIPQGSFITRQTWACKTYWVNNWEDNCIPLPRLNDTNEPYP